MPDTALLEAHDRLRAATCAEDRWAVVQGLFQAVGVTWITAGTAPRTRLESVCVRTSLPGAVMADYLGQQVHLDDPWITHSASSTTPDQLDVAQGRPGDLPFRSRKIQSVFADHGMRRVCLMPAYGGARPGALVLYATGVEEADALCDPLAFARLRQLCAIVAAHWRPEHGRFDASLTAADGAYQFRPVLSPRERDVLSWLAQGLQTAQIADRLGIEPVTVGKHLRSARHRLGARTREHALALAIRDGLIQP